MRVTWTDAVVVVTGGASGIGRQLALAAATRGARVAVVDIERERATSVSGEIEAAGGVARAYGCDVTDASAVQALADTIAADLGGVDIVFSNAGVVASGTVEQVSVADAGWMFSVNVLGVLHCIKAFLPLVREAAGAGRPAWLVTTGSENSVGVPPVGAVSVYTATKHALLGLMDALRRDLEGSGVSTALLCPGLVATDLGDARRNRQGGFGGPEHLSPERAGRLQAMLAAQAQDAATTARICLDGMEAGEFLIITDPKVRDFATRRLREIEQALDAIDRRLPG